MPSFKIVSSPHVSRPKVAVEDHSPKYSNSGELLCNSGRHCFIEGLCGLCGCPQSVREQYRAELFLDFLGTLQDLDSAIARELRLIAAQPISSAQRLSEAQTYLSKIAFQPQGKNKINGIIAQFVAAYPDSVQP